MQNIPEVCPIPPDAAEISRLHAALSGLTRYAGGEVSRPAVERLKGDKGTDGRKYGGDPDLIHIADGRRAEMGEQIGTMLDMSIRASALESGARTDDEMMYQPICPGCYMVALYNAAVSMAQANGQDVRELARTMANAFAKLATDPNNPALLHMEHMDVLTDEAEASNPAIAGFILPHMESM